MATLTTIPELVLPGRNVRLQFVATAGGNYVKVWCTSAPRTSQLRKKLDDTQAARVLVVSESDISKTPEYTFDVGGIYTLEIEEFQKGAEAYGGRYRGDPDGYRTETREISSSVTVSVATSLEAEIGVAPDTATLRLYVRDSQIKATTGADHGETTPAIVRPTTDKARAAADDPDIAALLAGFANEPATSLLLDWETQISNWITKFNDHIASATFHASADTDNTIADSFRDPKNLKSLVKSLTECARRYLNHIQNIDPTASSPEPGSASYHQPSTQVLADWENMLIAPGGSTVGACFVLFSDIYRCLAAHKTNTDVHSTSDTVPLLTVGELVQLHQEFLSKLSTTTPTVPDNEHSAKVLLVSSAGFKQV